MRFGVSFTILKTNTTVDRVVDLGGYEGAAGSPQTHTELKRAIAPDYGVGASGVRLNAVAQIGGKDTRWAADESDANASTSGVSAAPSGPSPPTLAMLIDPARTRNELTAVVREFKVDGVNIGGDVEEIRAGLIVSLYPESEEAKALTSPAPSATEEVQPQEPVSTPTPTAKKK